MDQLLGKLLKSFTAHYKFTEYEWEQTYSPGFSSSSSSASTSSGADKTTNPRPQAHAPAPRYSGGSGFRGGHGEVGAVQAPRQHPNGGGPGARARSRGPQLRARLISSPTCSAVNGLTTTASAVVPPPPLNHSPTANPRSPTRNRNRTSIGKWPPSLGHASDAQPNSCNVQPEA